jgi:hypothetical protein
MTRNRLNVIFLRTTHAVFAWASIMVVRSYPEPALLVRDYLYYLVPQNRREKHVFVGLFCLPSSCFFPFMLLAFISSYYVVHSLQPILVYYSLHCVTGNM